MHDAAGNLTNDGSHPFTYDPENRLATAGGVTYTYDGDGKRVKKSNGTLYWTGPGWDPLLETDLSGNATAEYVFFNGKRVARVDMPGNSPKYYFEDHLGSTDIVTNPTGGIVEESDYVPYGGEVVINGSDPNHFKFTGKERDAESGLDNFIKRYHASSLGRFMTPDPIMIMKQKLRDPQQWNMYSYARNNPLRFTDPTGQYVCQGNKDQCAQIKAGYDAAKKALDAAKPKSEQAKQLKSVLGFLGKPGKANGVAVTFGKLDTGTSAQTSTQTTRDLLGTNHTTTEIKFDLQQLNPDVRLTSGHPLEPLGNDTGAVLVHEGTHGRDDLAQGHDPQSKAEAMTTERNAYRNEGYVYDLLGVPSYVNPSLTAPGANRDQTIEKLANASVDSEDW